MKHLLLLGILLLTLSGKAQLDFSFSKNETLELVQVHQAYKRLDEKYKNAKWLTIGTSDAGLPIHCFIIDNNPIESIEDITKNVILINNGIHPGESCGVDASILFAEQCLLQNPDFLDSICIAIIPMYNIGGSLNRREKTRANQNGPMGQGFRGNAKHLDLNRDFLKADSKNSFAFYKLFHRLNPLIFIDTHSTNGADYLYQQTLIVSPPEKIGKAWSDYIHQEVNPQIFNFLDSSGIPSTFYVNVHGHSPDNGFSVFEETPIYSSGYASLFPCLSVVSETHMLKSYADRVKSTFVTLEAYSSLMAAKGHILKKKWHQSNEDQFSLGYFTLNYQIDSSKTENLLFKGYEMEERPSKIYSGNRRSFNRDKPFSKDIEYFGHLVPTDSVKIPEYFYLSIAQDEALRRILAQNIMGDTVELPKTQVYSHYVSNIEYSQKAYEGHLVAKKIDSKPIEWTGGYYLPVVKIKVTSENYRYLLNVLSPMGPGSFYKWNFFDSYFQQKEWFSDYLYEDIVEELIKSNENYQKVEITNPNEAYGVLYEFYKNDSQLFEKDAFTPPVFFSF